MFLYPMVNLASFDQIYIDEIKSPKVKCLAKILKIRSDDRVILRVIFLKIILHRQATLMRDY